MAARCSPPGGCSHAPRLDGARRGLRWPHGLTACRPLPPRRPLNPHLAGHLPKGRGAPQRSDQWWYYSHLESSDGRRWGFELVTFQIQRATLGPYYVAHFAVTDRQRKQFHCEDRQSQAPRPSRRRDSPPGGRLAYERLLGNGPAPGRDDAATASISVSPPADRPVLHDGGLVTFESAGDSYYYSRTRMESPAPSTTRRAGAHGQEPGLVRQAVGQLPGHGRRLGLVQHAARRRQRPDAQPDPQPVARRPSPTRTYVTPGRPYRHLAGQPVRGQHSRTWTSPHTASPTRAVGGPPSAMRPSISGSRPSSSTRSWIPAARPRWPTGSAS